MPTSTTAWMQEVERRTMPKPSVQGCIYSVSRVESVLGYIYGLISLSPRKESAKIPAPWMLPQ